MVKVEQIMNEIEKIAPKYLKEDYDNVGLMVGNKENEVKRVLIALDCTNDVIDEAIYNKVDLIITHHPLFFRKPKRIVNEELIGEKVIKLIKNDINLYSCHTNLDNARNGINDKVMRLLGFNSACIIEPKDEENTGCGRIAYLDTEITIEDLAKIIKERLKIKNLRIAKSTMKIKKIAVINGSGQDFFEKAREMGADCIITGDTTYHYVSDYKEMGISIIDAGHFGTEYLAFLDSLIFLKDRFSEVKFIKSKKNKDPYEFV